MMSNITALNGCSQALVVFAKYPVPGRVKTRLAQTIGDAAACEIYRSFTDVIIEKTNRIQNVRIRLDIDPATDDSFSYFMKRYPNIAVSPQSGADLGARMLNSFTSAFSSGLERVCVIGTDSPDLPSEIIADAFNALARNDIVIGPSNDGGYYLIGMNRPTPELFENIAWSTDAVCKRTLEHAEAIGVSFLILPRFFDVDTSEDLFELYKRIDTDQGAHPFLGKLKSKIRHFAADLFCV